MKRSNLILLIINIVALLLAILSYNVLPNEVVIQVSKDLKASNVVPKKFAIFIPLIITFVGSLLYKIDDSYKRNKYIIVAILGNICAILTLILNRVFK